MRDLVIRNVWRAGVMRAARHLMSYESYFCCNSAWVHVLYLQTRETKQEDEAYNCMRASRHSTANKRKTIVLRMGLCRKRGKGPSEIRGRNYRARQNSLQMPDTNIPGKTLPKQWGRRHRYAPMSSTHYTVKLW